MIGAVVDEDGNTPLTKATLPKPFCKKYYTKLLALAGKRKSRKPLQTSRQFFQI
jgi:hypothetical protein